MVNWNRGLQIKDKHTAKYVIFILISSFYVSDIPWLLLPGLCCIGIAGLGTLATNLQVRKSVDGSAYLEIAQAQRL